MRVVLIDNDPLFLTYFEKVIREVGEIEIMGKYIDPHQAVQAILQDCPDVVFLDIEMPKLNGIELAKQVQNSLPQTNIVFVSENSKYAVKAFELNAIGYLLKPVYRKRLVKTIHRLRTVDKHSPSTVNT